MILFLFIKLFEKNDNYFYYIYILIFIGIFSR